MSDIEKMSQERFDALMHGLAVQGVSVPLTQIRKMGVPADTSQPLRTDMVLVPALVIDLTLPQARDAKSAAAYQQSLKVAETYIELVVQGVKSIPLTTSTIADHMRRAGIRKIVVRVTDNRGKSSNRKGLYIAAEATLAQPISA